MRIAARLVAGPRRVIVLLGVLGCLFFMPGIGSVHLFDWDEANFAEASREMIESGNYSQVTIGYQPFYEKPPLYFWLQVLSMKVFGINEFAARFVNACCGVATLVAAYCIGARLYGSLFGLLWALAFFGSFLPHLFFKSGIIDPVFNLLIFLGLSTIAKALASGKSAAAGAKPRHRTRLAAVAGLFIGLAILAKGPVALLVAGLVMFVYWAMQRFEAPGHVPRDRRFPCDDRSRGIGILRHRNRGPRHDFRPQLHCLPDPALFHRRRRSGQAVLFPFFCAALRLLPRFVLCDPLVFQA